MNIYHKLEDIKLNNIMFYKPTINKIAHYMYFYKVAYNIESFILNTLLIEVNIKDVIITKDTNNYKVSIIIDDAFLNKIKEVELTLLNKMNQLINKQIILSCYKFLIIHKNVYTYNEYPTNITLFLRISGIWESDTQLGLTTKLFNYQP
jgi:hypothetical protein